MLTHVLKSASALRAPPRPLAVSKLKPKLAKEAFIPKHAPRLTAFTAPHLASSRTRSYCSKVEEDEDDEDVTIVSEDNPKLTHKEAIDMLEQNGLLKCDKAYQVFSTTDPVCFQFTDPHSGFTPSEEEALDEDVSKSEQDELYMDNWLHSALAVIGIVSVLDDILKPGSRVLDLACGNGYMTTILAKMVSPGGRVIGIDHSIEKLEAAQHSIGVHFPELIQVVRLLEGDVYTEYPKDQKFDAIHVAGAVQEVPQGWLKLLRPEGCLIAATPEIEPNTGETQFMLRKFHVNKDGAVLPVNMMFVNYEELVEPKL